MPFVLLWSRSSVDEMHSSDACDRGVLMLMIPAADAAADMYAAAAAAALTHCSGSERLLQRIEGRDTCDGFLSGANSHCSVTCGRPSLACVLLMRMPLESCPVAVCVRATGYNSVVCGSD